MLSSLLISAMLLTATPKPPPAQAKNSVLSPVPLDKARRAALLAKEAEILGSFKSVAKKVKDDPEGITLLHEFLNKEGTLVVLLVKLPFGAVTMVGSYNEAPESKGQPQWDFIGELFE